MVPSWSEKDILMDHNSNTTCNYCRELCDQAFRTQSIHGMHLHFSPPIIVWHVHSPFKTGLVHSHTEFQQQN